MITTPSAELIGVDGVRVDRVQSHFSIILLGYHQPEGKDKNDDLSWHSQIKPDLHIKYKNWASRWNTSWTWTFWVLIIGFVQTSQTRLSHKFQTYSPKSLLLQFLYLHFLVNKKVRRKKKSYLFVDPDGLAHSAKTFFRPTKALQNSTLFQTLKLHIIFFFILKYNKQNATYFCGLSSRRSIW